MQLIAGTNDFLVRGEEHAACVDMMGAGKTPALSKGLKACTLVSPRHGAQQLRE